MKALLVDDSKAARFAMSKLLRDQGLEVDVAASGEEALDKISSYPKYDLVLMDQSMPGMGGIAATSEITKNEKTKHIPVVLCTGNEGDKLEQMAEEAGAIGVLTKPPQEDKLRQVINQVREKKGVETVTGEDIASVTTLSESQTVLNELKTGLAELKESLTALQADHQKLKEEVPKKVAIAVEAVIKNTDKKINATQNSIKSFEERLYQDISRLIKEQLNKDTANQKIQLEQLRQQVENALDNIQEQEQQLRHSLLKEVREQVTGLVGEKIDAMKKENSQLQNQINNDLDKLDDKISALQGGLLVKSSIIAIVAAGIAFAASALI